MDVSFNPDNLTIVERKSYDGREIDLEKVGIKKESSIQED